MLQPLPYPSPERLAIIWTHSPGANVDQDWPSPGQYSAIVSQNSTFQELAIAHGGNLASIGSAAENNFVFNLVKDAQFWRRGPDGYYLLGPWLGGLAIAIGLLVAIGDLPSRRASAQTAPSGRYQVLNAASPQLNTTILLDTATGAAWVICPLNPNSTSPQKVISWCRMPRAETTPTPWPQP